MNKDRDKALRTVEETQESLRHDIKESVRLIETSQALIERHRRTTPKG